MGQRLEERGDIGTSGRRLKFGGMQLGLVSEDSSKPVERNSVLQSFFRGVA